MPLFTGFQNNISSKWIQHLPRNYKISQVFENGFGNFGITRRVWRKTSFTMTMIQQGMSHGKLK